MGREYQTRIAFRRSDGWARFTQWRDEVQIWDSVALGEDSWVSGDAGHWIEGDTDLQARILGHHFLAMVLAPDRVFRQLGPARKGRLDDEPVVWVSGRDVAGHPVELALRSTGRPVAARITWGGAVGTLTLRFYGWERLGPVQLPLSVRIDQGQQRQPTGQQQLARERLGLSAGDVRRGPAEEHHRQPGDDRVRDRKRPHPTRDQGEHQQRPADALDVGESGGDGLVEHDEKQAQRTADSRRQPSEDGHRHHAHPDGVEDLEDEQEAVDEHHPQRVERGECCGLPATQLCRRPEIAPVGGEAP